MLRFPVLRTEAEPALVTAAGRSFISAFPPSETVESWSSVESSCRKAGLVRTGGVGEGEDTGGEGREVLD